MASKSTLKGKHAELFEEIRRQVGDGEPTDTQYRQLARLAYVDHSHHFCDYWDDGTRWVRCYQGTSAKKAKVFGDGPDTGHAYWAYRQALDKVGAPE